MARPAPLRVMGKRGREDGRGEFLGSRWNGGSDWADGARASQRPALSQPSVCSACAGPYEGGGGGRASAWARAAVRWFPTCCL